MSSNDFDNLRFDVGSRQFKNETSFNQAFNKSNSNYNISNNNISNFNNNNSLFNNENKNNNNIGKQTKINENFKNQNNDKMLIEVNALSISAKDKN